MPRAPTTLDAFNAIAEPKRRSVLTTIARGGNDLGVGELVHRLGWPQPQVSKHLAVLREVGLVSVRRRGRERRYTVNADQLRPIHEWTGTFERFWRHQLGRIKLAAEAKAASHLTSDSSRSTKLNPPDKEH